ncbi:hypothetical protein JCM10914A_05360 [Paenibacillus sp. JCM 10914]|uniref:DUF559 domain-containing protein n=1 Tax=Paenibacillus sp. JCM 10914 TaxID=1236974 RepID=UPI0003CC625C|nr:DUF559 domain-containing protein [Paenibacillus sp. JCM 10914]GAE07037.1 helicase [Paenibacillus sp. JCM 10914]
MEFEHAHDEFIHLHLNRRSGERRGRLERGHREAEKLFCRKVWWPLNGKFDDLHPEFEVLDWRGRSYFCDFAYLTPNLRLMIEIKGFGPHVTDMDRQKYCNELNRETFLTAMGYRVISFAYDDVSQRADLCITLLRMVLNHYQPNELSGESRLKVSEREILRLAYTLARPIRPIDVKTHLSINHRTAVRLLQGLCDRGILLPIAGAEDKHVVKYALRPQASQGLW